MLEGSVEYSIDGQALATYGAGDALVVPPETVHAVRNIGSGRAALLATYLVEKGKPFLARCALVSFVPLDLWQSRRRGSRLGSRGAA